MVEHKPKEPSNNYLYISGVGVVGLAIVGYLLYNKFKKPEQTLIDVPSPADVSVNSKPDHSPWRSPGIRTFQLPQGSGFRPSFARGSARGFARGS